MSYRYYLIQRPPMPGSFPKPIDNKVIEVVSFDSRQFCSEIRMETWGYVEYEKPLAPAVLADYEMVERG